MADRFQDAVDYIGSLPTNRAGPSSTTKLRLYGLYKVATVGKCSTPAPSAWSVTARAKWGAWHDLGDMDRKKACRMYADEIVALVESDKMTDLAEKDRQGRKEFLSRMREESKKMVGNANDDKGVAPARSASEPSQKPSVPSEAESAIVRAASSTNPTSQSTVPSIKRAESAVASEDLSPISSAMSPDDADDDGMTKQRLQTLRELQTANLQRLESLEQYLTGSSSRVNSPSNKRANELHVLLDRLTQIQARIEQSQELVHTRLDRLERRRPGQLFYVLMTARIALGIGVFGIFILKLFELLRRRRG